MTRRDIGLALLLTGGMTMAGLAGPRLLDNSVASVTIYASGLNDPRGLAFGPDGRLYVAEAGSGGGGMTTIGACDQVAPPVGPFTAGYNARVLRIDPNGATTVIADGLPSTEASPLVGGDKQGASAVAMIGQRLYTLISGAGCSHGHAEAVNGIFETGAAGVTPIADLSAWLLANPGAKGAEVPRAADYEPDGTWFSMIPHRGRLFVVEPNHGLLVSVHPRRGDIRLEEDLFDRIGDFTPTAIASSRDDLYIGTLGQIAFVPGIFPPVPDLDASFEGAVYRLSPTGAIAAVADGLKAVVGMAFDKHHRLYVLQSPIFVPGTGSLVRIAEDGTVEPVLTDLVFPASLVRGRDGAFYLTQCGFHCAPGAGEVLRVVVPD
jgi:hypothetical protein